MMPLDRATTVPSERLQNGARRLRCGHLPARTRTPVLLCREPPARKARSMLSPIFDAKAWREVPGFQFEDITYHRAVDQGTVRVAFNRPEVRNAFRPHTVDELYTALEH